MKEQDLQDAEYAFPYHYVSRFKDGFNQTFTDTWGIHYVSTIEYLLQRLVELQWSSLLDIGCGDGRMTREIKLRFPYRNVSGIDFSTRAIQLAKAMNQDIPDISFDSRDITIRQSIETYDIALLMEVLEHIPLESTSDFIAGVHAQLVTGGTLLLTVPHANKPIEYKHFRHFDSISLRAVLEPNFEIIEILPFERRSLMIKLLRLLLGNRLYILNSTMLLNLTYRFYKKNLFHCRRENDCQRIFVLAKAR